MQKVGYALLDKDNNEIKSWGNILGQDVSIPDAIFFPNGNVVHSPGFGIYPDGYNFVEKWIDGDITKQFLKSGETFSFDGEKVIITWQYRMPNESEYADAVQKHIDAIAQSKQYSDGVSLSSYVNSTNMQWKTEAETFVAWRDAVWIFVFNKLSQVTSGTITQPSIEELINELPTITW